MKIAQQAFGPSSMITLPELAAQALGSFLASDMKDRFGSSHARLAELIPFAARLALECIGNSDALYHNVEHTMLVTLAGQDIFKGRALLKPSTPDDYANFIVACLAHDTSAASSKGMTLTATSSMGPPQGFVAARILGRRTCSISRRTIEAVRVGSYRGSRRTRRRTHARMGPRFPYSSLPDDKKEGIDEEASLLRAADLIGQLGDPHYLRKVNALYYEFEEIGLNRQLGYESPADLVDKYSQFYWNANQSAA